MACFVLLLLPLFTSYASRRVFRKDNIARKIPAAISVDINATTGATGAHSTLLRDRREGVCGLCL